MEVVVCVILDVELLLVVKQPESELQIASFVLMCILRLYGDFNVCTEFRFEWSS